MIMVSIGGYGQKANTEHAVLSQSGDGKSQVWNLVKLLKHTEMQAKIKDGCCVCSTPCVISGFSNTGKSMSVRDIDYEIAPDYFALESTKFADD